MQQSARQPTPIACAFDSVQHELPSFQLISSLAMALAKAAEPAYGIARLIGEGYGKPDGKDETPIDIQYAKIAEWLV